jgi:hypothetical protein
LHIKCAFRNDRLSDLVPGEGLEIDVLDPGFVSILLSMLRSSVLEFALTVRHQVGLISFVEKKFRRSSWIWNAAGEFGRHVLVRLVVRQVDLDDDRPGLLVDGAGAIWSIEVKVASI